MRQGIREAIELCKSVGLEPVLENNQYKVRNNDGVLLFNFHLTPSDPNWFWNIRRHLRKVGLLPDKQLKKEGKTAKRLPAIDLKALKSAQDRAISNGEHVPTLDDLENSTEFFTRIRRTNISEYSEEACNIMVARASDAPWRINAVRQRVQKVMNEHRKELIVGNNVRLREQGKRTSSGQGATAEFIRIAIEEIAPVTGLRAWSTSSAGRQALMTLHNGKDISLWAVDLINATCDKIEDLKCGEIDESRKKDTILVEEKSPTEIPLWKEVTPLEERFEFPTELVADGLRDRYAEVLFYLLTSNKESIANKKPIFERLDKLVGLG